MATSSESEKSEKMQNRKYVSMTMPGPMVDQIDAQLRGTDSRSEWIREAVRQRFEREEMQLSA